MTHDETLIYAAELVDGGVDGVYWPTYLANGCRDFDGTRMRHAIDLCCDAPDGEGLAPYAWGKAHRVLILCLAAAMVSSKTQFK